MKRLSFLLAPLLVCGCVLHKSHDASFDGLSDDYGGDATVFASRVVDELGLRYAPARTNVSLNRAPGVFGDALEQELRKRGFGLSPDSGLGLVYHIDIVDDSQPVMGYVQVKTSDGRIFSFSREIFKGTAPKDPVPDTSSVSERSLPPSEPYPPMQKADEGETLTRGGTAKQIARRYKIPVDKFCAWNNVTPQTRLPKGVTVYLHEPAGFVDTAALSTPASTPVSTAVSEKKVEPAPVPPKKNPEPVKEPAKSKAKTDKIPATKPASVPAPTPAPEPQKIDTGTMNLAANTKGTSSVNQNGARTYTVKKPTKAGKLADRLGLRRRDFFDWNNFGANAELGEGYVVFVSKPDPGTIPVAQGNSTPPLPAPMEAKSPKSGSSVTTPQPSATASTPLTGTPAAVTTSAPLPVEDMSAKNNPLFSVAPTDYAKSWEILGGTMLKTNMENWAALAGYSLVWNPANDYELRSSATFYGDYIQAMKEFFAQLQASGLALRVNIYQGNHVTEISDN